MKIVLFGMPGSGKGTQGRLLEKEYKIPHISVGNIFRENIANGTVLGKQIVDLVNNGDFVPDEITCKLVDGYLSGYDEYILDGFPRNIVQSQWFKKNLSADYYFVLDTTKRVAKDRLLNRNEGRVDDSSDKLIEARFKKYDLDTANGIYFFKDELTIINGELSIEDVFNQIKETIDA